MNLPELIQPETSTWVLESLAQVLWQGTLLAVVAALLGVLLKTRSVQSRYLVHCIALGLTLALLPWNLWRLHSPETNPPAMQPAQTIAPVDLTTNIAAVTPVADEPKATVPELASGAEAARAAQRPPVQRFDWQRYANALFIAYLVGALAMSVRLVAGLWGCQRLRSVSQPVDDSSVVAVIERARTELGLRIAPVVSCCARVTTPVVVGVLKPVILLPPAILTQLTPAHVESLLLHELAHIRRYDHLVNLAQRIIEAVLFFHPAIWWLSHRISIEREHCCDDLAIRWGSEPCDYAESLVRMSEIRLRHNGLDPKSAAALAATGGRPTRLHTRVLRVLGMPLPGPTPGLTRRGLAILFAVGMVTAAVVASRAEDCGDKQAAEATADADRAVAEARANTFGLQGVQRIAFSQTYRQADGLNLEDRVQDDLANLWKVRDIQVADAELDRNRQATLLAWDGDRLLLEEFSQYQSGKSWRQTYFWDGQQGWIGATNDDERGETKEVYRYSALHKLTEGVAPFYYPQWVAAGGRLPWPGPEVLLDDHQVDPALTHYTHAAVETIDGVLCDVYDGPERGERIWIELATNSVKAVSRYYASDLSQEENWKVISEATGREFEDQQDYQRWYERQTDEQKSVVNARWSALMWKRARPRNLAVFSDYREITPGVHWPHIVDRIVVHGNGQYFLSKIEVTRMPDFNIVKMAANALPEPGVKVTDRTGEVPFEYVWSNDLTQADVERLRGQKLAEKQAEEEKTRQINETPINSIDDAIHILTEGPNTDPTIVWARAIKYLTEHSEPALPALIKTLDVENRDHPISKLAFALRAIGDARAVPALIRALPKTLQPSRSDYGLQIDDEELAHFMQEHDLGSTKGWTKIWGWSFDYGRAFREVVGALHKLTGQDFGEMQLNGIYLSGTDSQRHQKRLLYQRFAQCWADWWEANWQTNVDDPAYRKVNLAPLGDDKAAVANRNLIPPSGAGVELIDDVSGAILQSVHESIQRCFVDLDTGRVTGWPAEFPPLGQTRLDSPDLVAWARREGCDIMGMSYTPPGETEPLFCIMPLDLRAWQITEDEHRALPDMVLGKLPYPLLRPVDLLIPRRTIPEPHDRDHSGDSFLFVTREGTAGVLRLTAQVTEIKDFTGQISTQEDLFQNVGFYRGVKYELQTISAPAVADSKSDAKRSNNVSPNKALNSDRQDDKNISPEGLWNPDQVMDFHVVNAQTREPLPGAWLELQYAGPGIDFSDVKVQTTDDNGRSLIKLPDAPPTAVRVYPSKPGFVPLRVYWEGTPHPQMPESITIPLQPGAPFGGIVHNEQGAPIAGVKVSVNYWV